MPQNQLLRWIYRFLDLDPVREQLRPFYCSIGQPSVDPELMMRMLIVGYSMGIRSEGRLCGEVDLNLARTQVRAGDHQFCFALTSRRRRAGRQGKAYAEATCKMISRSTRSITHCEWKNWCPEADLPSFS